MTTTPDGLPRVIAIDDLVDLAIISLAENATPFEDVGWNRSSADHDGVAGASGSQISPT